MTPNHFSHTKKIVGRVPGWFFHGIHFMNHGVLGQECWAAEMDQGHFTTGPRDQHHEAYVSSHEPWLHNFPSLRGQREIHDWDTAVVFMFFRYRNWNVIILKGGFLDVFSGFPFSKAFAASMFCEVSGSGVDWSVSSANRRFESSFLLYVPGWRQRKFPKTLCLLGFFEKELSNEKNLIV